MVVKREIIVEDGKMCYKIQMDNYGRIIIPKEVREKVGSSVFKLIVEDGIIKLIPA